MTHKQTWAIVSTVIYVAFILAAVLTGFLNPSQIGLEWTIFWVVVVAGLCYYFYFKNVSYREVIYYAKKLDYHKDDLVALVPKLKETQDVPDPDHPHFFSPFAGIPLAVTNRLTEQLEPLAKKQQILPYR